MSGQEGKPHGFDDYVRPHVFIPDYVTAVWEDRDSRQWPYQQSRDDIPNTRVMFAAVGYKLIGILRRK